MYIDDGIVKICGVGGQAQDAGESKRGGERLRDRCASTRRRHEPTVQGDRQRDETASARLESRGGRVRARQTVAVQGLAHRLRQSGRDLQQGEGLSPQDERHSARRQRSQVVRHHHRARSAQATSRPRASSRLLGRARQVRFLSLSLLSHSSNQSFCFFSCLIKVHGQMQAVSLRLESRSAQSNMFYIYYLSSIIRFFFVL